MNKKTVVETKTQEINIAYMKLTKMSITSIKQAIALGHQLNDLKKEVKQIKQPWEKYAKKHFLNINKGTRLRYMRIARHVGHDYPKALHLLTRTTLISLSRLCGTDNIGTFLEMNGINLTFKLNNKSAKIFQVEVEELLDKSSSNNDSSNQSVPVKVFYYWLGNLERRL